MKRAKSIRIHIRNKKAMIRRKFLNSINQEEEIKKLYEKIDRKQKLRRFKK